MGGELAGAMSSNAHAANMVSGIFIATGQDAAHIIESSHASTVAMAEEEGLRFSVKLPTVIAGTVGGGTGLKSQRASMNMMLTNIDNPSDVATKRVARFVEVLSAGVLAGEFNLLTALAKGELASGHQKLGRSKA